MVKGPTVLAGAKAIIALPATGTTAADEPGKTAAGSRDTATRAAGVFTRCHGGCKSVAKAARERGVTLDQ